jgi:hypothetical protein
LLSFLTPLFVGDSDSAIACYEKLLAVHPWAFGISRRIQRLLKEKEKVKEKENETEEERSETEPIKNDPHPQQG